MKSVAVFLFFTLVQSLNLCTSPETLSPLRVEGNRVLNSYNEEVFLRGVNVGGWLVTENWMCGVTADLQTKGGGRYLFKTLNTRFGFQDGQKLLNVWYDNWLTLDDLDKLQSYQFNVLRVPYAYYNFQDESGQWISYNKTDGTTYVVSQPDFSRLDWIIAEAAKRGMYTILCNHIWWGQDGDFNGTISTNNDPYSDISQNSLLSQRQQNATIRILTAMAAHYRGNSNVAGIDLINEPSGSCCISFHDLFYRAVRRGDPDRIAFFNWVPIHEIVAYKWNNSIYEEHDYSKYNTGDLTTNQNNYFTFYNTSIFAKTIAQNLSVPFYIGEFQGDTPSLPWLLDRYNLDRMHWTMWTYKTVDMGGWSLMAYSGSYTKLNLTSATYNQINSTWHSLSTWKKTPSLVYYKTMISGNLTLKATPKFANDTSKTLWDVKLDSKCLPSCTDGIKNQNETGVDCGGVCSACPTCSDGIRNQNETNVDCGGPCPACPNCTDGIRNQNEIGVDCGGPCPACPTCSDGIRNQNEMGIDCGGPCPACPTCSDGIKNQDEVDVDCGGVCPACPSCTDGVRNQGETGIDCGGPCSACPTCNDGIKNQNEVGVDCGGVCPVCPNCTDGIRNQNEIGIDCGGVCNNQCAPCNNGIQNQNETGIDCGGVCPNLCPSCTDGIKNQDETGIDCGGVCEACRQNGQSSHLTLSFSMVLILIANTIKLYFG